jgi:iron complex transport system substrate-binding protein
MRWFLLMLKIWGFPGLFPDLRLWIAVPLLLTASAVAEAAAGNASDRVMSVNQCVEQMIASFAAEKLVSVTWLSHRSHAPLHELLWQIPANHAEIEEVLSISPDVVIGGEYGAAGLQALLQKFGIAWRQMPLHQSVEMYYSNWSLLGKWLQREQQSTEIISEIQTTLAALSEQLKPLNVNAVVVNPNGWVAGSGNFQHAVLEAAGLHNIVAAKGIRGWAQLSLEQLVVWQPDMIIIASAGYAGRSKATDWQRHPVLAAYISRYPLLVVDAESLSCDRKAIGKYGTALLRHLLGTELASVLAPGEKG